MPAVGHVHFMDWISSYLCEQRCLVSFFCPCKAIILRVELLVLLDTTFKFKNTLWNAKLPPQSLPQHCC